MADHDLPPAAASPAANTMTEPREALATQMGSLATEAPVSTDANAPSEDTRGPSMEDEANDSEADVDAVSVLDLQQPFFFSNFE